MAQNESAPPVSKEELEEAERLLEELTRLSGLSGHEEAVARRVMAYFSQAGLDVRSDAMGNVWAERPGGGCEADRPVLVFAHMDELGLLVRQVTPEGFLRVERLGGVPERVLPGTPVEIQTPEGPLAGVVGLKSHHVTPAEEKYVALPVASLYVDAGLRSREEAVELGILPGTPITYSPRFIRLRGTLRASKSMDNRAGLAALLILARRLQRAELPGRVVLAGTVQEEFNLSGVLGLARRLRPRAAICLDIAVARDTPDLGDQDVALGGGPVVHMYSFHGRGMLAGLLPHPALVQAATAAAHEAGIPIQRDLFMGGLTDASFLGGVDEGIPALDLGIPCRYTHSPVETVDLVDVVLTARLLEATLRRLPPEFERYGRL